MPQGKRALVWNYTRYSGVDDEEQIKKLYVFLMVVFFYDILLEVAIALLFLQREPYEKS